MFLTIFFDHLNSSIVMYLVYYIKMLKIYYYDIIIFLNLDANVLVYFIFQ